MSLENHPLFVRLMTQRMVTAGAGLQNQPHHSAALSPIKPLNHPLPVFLSQEPRWVEGSQATAPLQSCCSDGCFVPSAPTRAARHQLAPVNSSFSCCHITARFHGLALGATTNFSPWRTFHSRSLAKHGGVVLHFCEHPGTL